MDPLKTVRFSRRNVMSAIAGLGGAAATAALLSASSQPRSNFALKGNVKHSVCRWCYTMSLENLCSASKKIGVQSIELVAPEEWPLLKKYELDCAMCPGPFWPSDTSEVSRAWTHPENHDLLVKSFEARIDEVADAGFKNLLCLSGPRGRFSDEEGIDNLVLGFKRIMSKAEQRKVTICLEPINSIRSNLEGVPDYFCDRVEMAAEICRRVGSDHMKILFDIYHVQIMQGDVIRKLEEFSSLTAHYHTAGNPGRHEPDGNQEINYPGIITAIINKGFTGYIGHEFIPRGPLSFSHLRFLREAAALEQGVRICDV